jgi:hypothetical protein
MIYTFGYTESYEQYFKEQGVPRKVGVRDDYGGGIVFQTVSEATGYLSKKDISGYSVYGLLCGWENTYWSEEDGFQRLLTNTDLTKDIADSSTA